MKAVGDSKTANELPPGQTLQGNAEHHTPDVNTEGVNSVDIQENASKEPPPSLPTEKRPLPEASPARLMNSVCNVLVYPLLSHRLFSLFTQPLCAAGECDASVMEGASAEALHYGTCGRLPSPLSPEVERPPRKDDESQGEA